MLQTMIKQNQKFNYFAYPEIVRQVKPELLLQIGTHELFIVVCRFMNTNIDEARSKSRKRDLVMSRQVFYYFAEKYCFKTLAYIGSTLGCDHATVLYGKRQVENLKQYNREFLSKIENLDVEINKIMEDNLLNKAKNNQNQ